LDVLILIIGFGAFIILILRSSRFAGRETNHTSAPHDEGGDDILQVECPECKQMHDVDYHTCPYCKHSSGNKIKDSQCKDKRAETEMQCPKCGTTHDKDYHTCPYCKHKYSPLTDHKEDFTC